MASFTFGSSLSSCSNSSGERAQVAEQFDDVGNIDPERLLQCPYDANHHIRACRFPYHLIKCRKNHPKLAKELKTCPFNARHLVPPQELAQHVDTCVDRVDLEPPMTDESGRWQKPPSTWTNPDQSEDWDAEADDAAAPFIWGKSSSATLTATSKPGDQTGQSIRAPNSVPW